MRQRRRELPKPAIADVLKELGAEDVPTGYGWIRMSCPFHEDRTPSAAVNHELDGFTCHSCGRRGDALKLLQTELGLSFTAALDRASGVSGESGNRHRDSYQRRAKTRRPSDLLKGGNQ